MQPSELSDARILELWSEVCRLDDDELVSVAFARAVLAEAQRAAVPQWVACSEQLPERNVDVLVYCSDTREQFVAFLRADGYFQYALDPSGGEISCSPAHWQPTPQPPKEAQG